MTHRDADFEIDLIADWTELVRSELKKRGYVAPAADDSARFAFFNLLRRQVTPARREVKVAADLVCPPELVAGYRELMRKVTDGEDLRPHVSRKLVDIDYNDALLNDVGVHHLHLGTDVEADGFVKRTGPVLFVRFTDTAAFFIVIQKHGTWADPKILQEFQKNWPDASSEFELKGTFGLEYDPTSADIKKLRKAGLQYLVSVGGKVLAPMGGGYMASGISTDVVMRSGAVLRQLRAYEEAFIKAKDAVFADAEARGIVLRRPVRVRLEFDAEQNARALSEDERFGLKLGPPRV